VLSQFSDDFRDLSILHPWSTDCSSVSVMTFSVLATATALIGSSAAIRDLQQEAELAARLDVRVLIAGEYGVGKKRLARLIHAEGPRHRGPFIRIRCGREAEPCLHTHLFGGEDATATAGAFERASGGTILLQDVDSLTPPLQDALRGYLATARPGTRRGAALNVQILTSTQVPLINKVLAGAFCEDLYYLLNTMYLPIPPLRERLEDVEPLLEHFTSHYARRYRIGRPQMTADWYAQFQSYDWPANVRELQTTAATFVAQSAQSLK
jgi:DNA-binding NtrC family response regulator